MNKHLRVLIVEDSAEDAELVVHELRRAGYDPIRERVDTPAGMASALDRHGWDIVISDYALQEFGALAALELLKRREIDLPFIVVSGAIGEEAAVAVVKAGAHDYLMKDKLARLAPTIERELGDAQARQQRRRAEQALQQSEERYRRLIELSPDAHYVQSEGKFVLINSAGARLLGATDPDQIIGKPVLAILHPDYQEIVRARMQQLAAGLPVPMIEEKYLRLDGTPVDVEVAAAPLTYLDKPAVQVIVRDITERKRTEDALRESRELFRVLIEGVKDYAIFMLDPQGNIASWNAGGEQFFGYRAAEVVGRPVSLLYSNEDVRRGEPQHELQVAAAEGRFEREFERVRKDGSRFWARVVIAALHDQTGALRGFARLTHDITERKRSEEQVRRSREQLRALAVRLQSAREEERTHVAREIHDELGQALTGLKMELAWLERRTSATTKEIASAVEEKIKSMFRLLDQTINAVRRIATELRPGVLDDLGLAAAIEWQTQEFQKRTGLGCDLRIAAPGLMLLGPERATAMFRIFQEVLTNVARHAQATKVSVSMTEENGALVSEVRDNGKGITEEQIAASRSLGLLGMQERAHMFGGSINFVGKPGGGTTVKIRIPLGEEAERNENSRRG